MTKGEKEDLQREERGEIKEQGVETRQRKGGNKILNLSKTWKGDGKMK